MGFRNHANLHNQFLRLSCNHFTPCLLFHVATQLSLTSRYLSSSRLDAWNRSRFLRDLSFSCLEPLRSLLSCFSPATAYCLRSAVSHLFFFISVPDNVTMSRSLDGKTCADSRLLLLQHLSHFSHLFLPEMPKHIIHSYRTIYPA